MKSLLRFASLFTLAGVMALIMSVSYAAEKPDGATIFSSNCSMCHGVDGKGFAAIKTPDFTDPKWQAAHTDKELLEAIGNGVKGTAMPSFKDKLSQDQIQTVLKYIRSLGASKK